LTVSLNGIRGHRRQGLVQSNRRVHILAVNVRSFCGAPLPSSTPLRSRSTNRRRCLPPLAGTPTRRSAGPASEAPTAAWSPGSWCESQADLTRLRSDFGRDGCTGIDGWYVDDIKVLTCKPKTNLDSPPAFRDEDITTSPHGCRHAPETSARDDLRSRGVCGALTWRQLRVFRVDSPARYLAPGDMLGNSRPPTGGSRFDANFQ
jgi:hypothetical protein